MRLRVAALSEKPLRLRYEVRRKTHDSLFCGLKPQSFVTNPLKLSPEKIDKVKIATAYFLAILVYRDCFFFLIFAVLTIKRKLYRADQLVPKTRGHCHGCAMYNSTGQRVALWVSWCVKYFRAPGPGTRFVLSRFLSREHPPSEDKKKNKRVLINCHIMNIITYLSFWCLL